ncbi:hypothetical protein MASR2M78_08570 [Treponema sp.]
MEAAPIRRYNRGTMKRSAIAIAATFLSTLVLCTAAWGQSRLPANPAVYLQNTNLAGNGDPDGISVIFFQVPEGTLSPLYFAVYSPGTNSTQNNRDSTNAGAMATTFTLIGGTGAYSGTNSQNIQFTAANTPYQGTVLGQQSYTNTNGNTWVYFPGVDYSQGEKIGNQYIFKLVVDTNAIVTWGAGTNAYTGQTTTNGGDKNAFQVDISTTNSGAPTGISGVRSFAYNWKVCFYEISTDIWNFYPLVPDTALATDFINFYNWDADDGDSWTILNKSGATLTNDVWDFLTTRTPPGTVGTVTTEIGTNNAWGNFSHSIGALSETQGTWNMRVTANAGGTALNTTAIVASLSGAAAVPPVAPSGTILPIYAAAYNPPGPDHVVLNPTSKTVISGTPTDVPISMQIVDSTGTPVPTVRKVRVQTNGTATVNGVDNDEIVTTNAAGSASFFVRQNGNAVVLVTLTSNGTFGSDNFGPGADDSATVTFQADLPPTISSATNLSYPSNQAAPINLPVITIADSGAANITASNLTGDIRIRPSTLNTGLTAPFLNSVTTPTLTVGGVGTGAVNGTVSYLGGASH